MLYDWLIFAQNSIARVWHTWLAIAMKDYSGLETFQSQEVMKEILGKIQFRPIARKRRKYFETPKSLSASGGGQKLSN